MEFPLFELIKMEILPKYFEAAKAEPEKSSEAKA